MGGVDLLMLQQSVKNSEPPAPTLLGDALGETAAALVGSHGSLTTTCAREDSLRASMLLQSYAVQRNSDIINALPSKHLGQIGRGGVENHGKAEVGEGRASKASENCARPDITCKSTVSDPFGIQVTEEEQTKGEYIGNVSCEHVAKQRTADEVERRATKGMKQKEEE